MSLFDEALFRTILREEVRHVVRDELGRAPTAPAAGDLLKVLEAAAIAAVTPQTIRSWISSGRLPARGSGRLLRVKRTDLERLFIRPGPSDGTPEAEADAAMLRRRRRFEAGEEK